jgi:hypothetical protein
VRAAYQTAHELGERLLVMAQSLHDPALLLEGRFGIGISLYYLGDLWPPASSVRRGSCSMIPSNLAPMPHFWARHRRRVLHV